MSEERERGDEKMDGLLRHWGAEEAARQARVDYLRPPAPQRAVPAPSVWQWLPLAASLILVGGAGVLLLVTQPGAAPSTAEMERLREAVEAAERKGKAAEKTLFELRAERERLAAGMEEMQKALAAAQAEVQAKVSAAAEQTMKIADERLREMTRMLSESDAALKAAREQLVVREQEAAALRQAAEGARAAEEEIRRLRAQVAQQNEAISSVLSDKKILANRLTALQAERDVMRTMLRRLYVAAAAPGATGASARQAAARHNRLLERFGELRRTIRSPEVRKLADQIEVALTRLELLDPARSSDVDGVASFVAQTDICGRAEVVLAAGEEPAAVRSWLLEAQLVLAEVKNESP